MIIRWLPEAADDLESIHFYLTQQLPTRASYTVNEIYRTAKSLADIPYRGRLRRDSQTYELILPRVPYIIFYRVQREAVDILYIRHVSQSRPGASQLRS